MPTALPPAPPGQLWQQACWRDCLADQGLGWGPGRLCGCVGGSSVVLGGVERPGVGDAQLGRMPENIGGQWGLCGRESGGPAWTLHPVLPLSLVKKGVNGSPSPSSLLLGNLRPRQGTIQTSVPRGGGTACTDGHREADTWPGKCRDPDRRAASPQEAYGGILTAGPRGGWPGGQWARCRPCLLSSHRGLIVLGV